MRQAAAITFWLVKWMLQDMSQLLPSAWTRIWKLLQQHQEAQTTCQYVQDSGKPNQKKEGSSVLTRSREVEYSSKNVRYLFRLIKRRYRCLTEQKHYAALSSSVNILASDCRHSDIRSGRRKGKATRLSAESETEPFCHMTFLPILPMFIIRLIQTDSPEKRGVSPI